MVAITLAIAVAMAFSIPLALSISVAFAIAVTLAMTIVLAIAMLTVQEKRVHDGRVARSNKVMLQMRLVVERDPTPAIHPIDAKRNILGQLFVQVVHAIVVASNSIRDVHRSTRVVITMLLDSIFHQPQKIPLSEPTHYSKQANSSKTHDHAQ